MVEKGCESFYGGVCVAVKCLGTGVHRPGQANKASAFIWLTAAKGLAGSCRFVVAAEMPRVLHACVSFMNLLSVFSTVSAVCRRLRATHLLLCLGLLAVPLAHAEWTELEKDDDITHFWDKASVRHIHVTRYVWTLTELPKAVKNAAGDNYLSTMTRWRVHCKTDTFVRLSVSYFEKSQGKGREVNAEDVQEWRTREAPIRPGTYLALLKKELCDAPS